MATSSKTVYLTRREHFSACHRLHSPHLSDAENAEVYGKCNNPNGHGHNYNVEVTLCGPVDPKTGMVYNLTDLKQDIKAAIMDVVDHKNLDKDVPHFASVPSTTENLVIFLWENMLRVMRAPQLLHEIKIYETENNIVIYRGNVQ